MENYREIVDVINGKTVPSRVPVCLWAIGQTYAPFAGIPDDQYYASPEKMLAAQLMFHEQFPDTFTVPGIWPDFGTIPELSAMGCQVGFPSNMPPQIIKPALDDPSQAESLEIPDPRFVPYTSTVLEYLKYFQKNLPRQWVEKFGYLDGHVFCGGPSEIGALMLGYDKFSYGMVDTPELIHILLRKVTDFIKRYIDAMSEIVGPPKRVIIWDHFPGMISKAMYREFAHPYLKEIFAYVQEAEIKIYHNENNYPHLLDIVSELSANVVHVGYKHDLIETRDRLNKCVMGNIHPINEMLYASNEEFVACCEKLIKRVGPGGRFLLSTAGGMAPECTAERMCLIIETADRLIF